jgi:hypothetical protein
MNTYAAVDIHVHVFLTSALVGGEGTDSSPGSFTPLPQEIEEEAGWAPRASLDKVENFFMVRD